MTEKTTERSSDPKITAVVVILLVLIGTISGYVLMRDDDDEKEPIVIGAILPMTGVGESYGGEMRDGMQLAIDEVNDDGGINGRKIELLVTDCESNPAKGAQILNDTEKTRKPLLYVSLLSSVSTAVSEQAEANDVMLMAMIASAPDLTQNKSWTYRYWPMAEPEVTPTLVSFDALGVKNVTLLYLDDEYGAALRSFAEDYWTKTGGNIIAVPYAVSGTNFTDLMQDHLDAEAIYFVGFDSHRKAAFPVLETNNYTGFVGTTNGATNPSMRELPGFEGVYVSASAIYNPNFIFAQSVSEKFEAKYGRSFNHNAAAGYDFIKMLKGLLEGKEISRENVKVQFDNGFIHPGVFGDVNVRAGENDFSFPTYRGQIVEGDLVYL